MAKISLSKGKAYTIVDDEDFEYLNQWKWHIVANRYAARRLSPSAEFPSGEYIYMHRQIMKTPKDMDTDHVNGNGLDNRKSNLRICTTRQNIMNRRGNSLVGFKGVVASGHRFKAQYAPRLPNGKTKNISLGVYATPEEAARAYDRYVYGLHGEFAALNFTRKGG